MPVAGQTRDPIESPQELRDSIDREELLRRFEEWFKASRDHFHDWREEAIAAFDFTAGHQWNDDDMQILRDQNRPVVTFNRIGPFISAVSGLEIGNRQSTEFYPRQVGKAGVNELLTGAVQWARDECDAEQEESESFRDSAICGIGVTQTRMDYTQDPQGMIIIDRVDPLECYFDPASRKKNMVDARFFIRVKDIPVEAAEEMFPDTPTADLHARWAEDQPDATRSPHNARIAPYYRIDQSGEIDRQRQQCRLVEVEWWEYGPSYRVLGMDGRASRLTPQQAGTYRMRAAIMGQPSQLYKDRTKKHYKAIVGAKVLTVMKGPDDGGFTYKTMTGKRDRNQSCWYGMVRAMTDPQMWANKFFSQSLHIINVNSKGGLLAETDAFVDIEEARDQFAEADAIIELNPGGLARVKEKEPPPFPAQINQMMAMALDAIPATAGMNLEMIAQQQQDQAGILEMQRKQQGMTVLAELFDAKRQYQKQQGRLMLWMVITFIADGRLVRIGGPEYQRYVPFVHEPGLAEYDVIVDEAPSSPNMKERVWAMIMQMFPMLRTMPLPPQAMLELMRYAPFPAPLIEKLQQIMQQPQPPNPQQQARMQLEQASAQQKQAAAQEHLSRAKEHQAHYVKAMADAQKARADAQVAPQLAVTEAQERAARIQNLRAQAIAALGKMQLDRRGQDLDEAEMAIRTLIDSVQVGHDMGMDHIDAQQNAQQMQMDQQLAQQQAAAQQQQPQ